MRVTTLVSDSFAVPSWPITDTLVTDYTRDMNYTSRAWYKRWMACTMYFPVDGTWRITSSQLLPFGHSSKDKIRSSSFYALARLSSIIYYMTKSPSETWSRPFMPKLKWWSLLIKSIRRFKSSD